MTTSRRSGVMVTVISLLLGFLAVTVTHAAVDEVVGNARADILVPQAAPDGVWGGFTALGRGTSDDVYAIALSDDTVWAGGSFYVAPPLNTGASGVPGTNMIAAWSDDTWHPLGAGMDISPPEEVYALAYADDTLWAGGTFTGASGVPDTNSVVAWSDDTWIALGQGASGTVGALATEHGSTGDDTLYTSGAFPTASSVVNTTRIASWSTADDTWSPLGTGADQTVSALALGDDTLFAGGNFSAASGVANTNKVAAWSNGSWSALGTGANGWVYTLSIHDDTLYMGGTFSSASGVAGTNKIAAWSGSSWSPVGSGMDGDVRALAVDDARGLVYAGGAFTSSGSTSLQRVAVWDTGIDEWIPLQFAAGSNGVGNTVRALALDDSIVYLGGQFTDAGGDANGDHIARWTWEPPQGSNALTADVDDSIAVTGEGLIGIPATGAVRIGSTVTTYTRDDSVTLSVRVPGVANGTYTIFVNAVGGEGDVGTVTVSGSTPPTPPPVFPPSEPLNVVGLAGDASAAISWAPPASSGSFPVTDYQVEVSPGEHSCLVKTPDLTCTIAGLTNGTDYTASVRALNGAGWGPWSTPSQPFTPVERTIVITGTRAEVKGRNGVRALGETTGLEGARLQARVHLAGEIEYYDGSQRTVGADGSFTWQRVTKKKVYVYFRALNSQVRSNRLAIPIR